MNHPLVDEFKQGACKWCCEETTIYSDNDRCEECDLDVIHCYICGRDEHWESKCRHVFQDRYFQWSGAGTGMMPDNNVRQSFLDLLAAMPAGFATDLRKAIRSGKFYTWLIAPMIGGGGLLELNGFKDYGTGRTYGSAILDLGENRHDNDELADGYRWMVSLYKRSTTRANKITMRWIDEWAEQREGVLSRLADDGCPNFANSQSFQ